jgi:type VI secretion system protein ImpD
VAEAALCPYISAASASLFGLDSMRELSYPNDLTKVFEQKEFLAWNKLRKYENTRFIGLTLPDMLMREPYTDDSKRVEEFDYQERVDDADKDLLWGNSCYAFGSVLIRAFANTGWFADIRGGVHDFGEGGVVKHLNYAKNRFEANNISPKPATITQVDDILERELSELGFIPLCSYHSIEKSVFYSNNSLHQPTEYSSEIATANAKLSSMIQYMLCVSRFGHYVKVIGRDKIGSFVGPEECQRIFQNWLNQYVTSSETESSELKARYPLSLGKVEVKEKPGRPGFYSCIMHLQPHFQLDQLVSSIQLITELAVGAVPQKALT